MNIQQKMEEINHLNYWDLIAFDFRANYFGDEVSLFIPIYENGEEDNTFCWEVKFLKCHKINSVTDVGYVLETSEEKYLYDSSNNHYPIKSYRGVQLYGYAIQKIEVSSYHNLLYRCDIELSVLFIEILCQDILVHKVPIKEQNFFWDNKQ